MARLQKTLAFAGNAAGREEAIENPLELISRPLYLDQGGQPDPALARWELPANDRDDGLAVDFARHKSADPIVVIGGFQFLYTLGVIPRWLIHDATRTDAEILMRERRLDALLESLSLNGRETAFDLFGKQSLHEWFQHSPDVDREGNTQRKGINKSKKTKAQYMIDARSKHCLRLKKAIDLITLIEAALRYRYGTGRTKNRTNRYTGISPEDVYPEIVWDVLWLEPIHYVMSSLPTENHVISIVERQGVADRFQQMTGSGPGALYWILKGAPGKYRNVEAACTICNGIYEDFPAANVTTVKPREYRDKMRLFQEKTRIEFKKTVEFAPEMGPE